MIFAFFLLSCFIFFFIFHIFFPPVGMLTGPWTLETMGQLKQKEHLIYWICALGVPGLSVAMNAMWRRWGPAPRSLGDSSSSRQDLPLRTGRRKYWKIALILISFGYAYLVVPRWNVNGPVELMEDGHAMEAARKSSMGQTWYKDIFFIYGPGLDVVQTQLAFTLFDESVAGMRKLRWILDPLGLLAALAIVWLVSLNVWPILFFVAVGMSGADFHMRMTLPLLAIFCVLIALRKQPFLSQRIWFFISGVLTFFAYFYSMENGPLLVLAMSVPLLMFSKDALLYYLGGVASCGGLFLLWGIFNGRIHYIAENFFMMKTIMLQAHGKPTPIFYEPVMEFISNPAILFQSRGAWVRWWLPPVLMGCLLAWTLDRWIQGNRSRRNFEGLFIASAGLVYFFVALGRTDYDHWLKGTAIYWISIVYSIDQLCFFVKTSPRTVWVKGSAVVGVAVLLGLLVKYANSDGIFHSAIKIAPWPQRATEPRPASLEKIGDIYVEPQKSEIMAGIVERIWKYAGKKEYVFIFSKEPLYYFLADVNNPVRYPLSIKMVTPKAVAEVVEALEKKKPRLVLGESWKETIYGEYYQKPIVDVILKHYEEKERFGGYVFLTLKVAGKK